MSHAECEGAWPLTVWLLNSFAELASLQPEACSLSQRSYERLNCITLGSIAGISGPSVGQLYRSNLLVKFTSQTYWSNIPVKHTGQTYWQFIRPISNELELFDQCESSHHQAERTKQVIEKIQLRGQKEKGLIPIVWKQGREGLSDWLP